MDWKQTLAQLAEAGLTQVQIAERCGVAQSTISALARGETRSPSFELGAALQKLLADLPAPEVNADRVDAPTPAAAGQGA
jgi:transcriptional regulator with XRE-family HTH domain